MNAVEVKSLKDKALSEARSAGSVAELEQVRVRYLGRKGAVPAIMTELKSVPAEERPEVGRLANELRAELQALISARKAELSAGVAASREAADITLPGAWRGIGARHPISRVVEDTIEIFISMGFRVADGPDIETAYYNFDALNTPEDHPSRDPGDTFWLNSELLLRTQTSPVQIRVMESQQPPVRIIAPGRCYRRDTMDATHSANFHQIEGLYVDRHVSMRDLKSDLSYFASQIMGKNVKIRFRPHFFPFTEPSVEYDFSCHLCGGSGCRVCKGSGWIEISGAGMVNPRVFEMVGYAAEEWTGYAFGMGVERIAMIKYGITDIRLLYENDARLLEQLSL